MDDGNDNFIQERTMRIIVSGGWGYGNLGDDALLEATAELLNTELPDAQTLWTTYDTKFTQATGIALSGPVIPSVHRYLCGPEAFWDISTVGKTINSAQWPYLLRRCFEKFLKPHLQHIFFPVDNGEQSLQHSGLSRLFQKSDIFLMSGGGYFNQWDTMFMARLRELELAHAAGCHVVLFGQSIGPFTKEQKTELKKKFYPNDRIFVRDLISMDELAKLGMKVELIPDMALLLATPQKKHPREICLIPAELPLEQINILAEELAELRGINLTITLTRRIYPDIVTARRLYQQLKKKATYPVSLYLPETYQEMRKYIEGAEWVLSRGLHGMILGWRSGSNVFALTTSRKIDGFLKEIGCPQHQVSEMEWQGNLSYRLAHVLLQPTSYNSREHERISQKIRESFRRAMDFSC